MSEKGWIKAHRKLLDSEVFIDSDPYILKFWVWLLLSANHKRTEEYRNGQYITLEPGWIMFSLKDASKAIFAEFGHETKIRIMIKHLIEHGMAHKIEHDACTVLAIENWGFYQSYSENATRFETHDSTRFTTQESTQDVTSLHYMKKKNKEEAKENVPLSEAEWDALDGELV